MILSRGLYLLVLEHADGAIHFQHGQGDFFIGRDSMFAHGALERVHADMLPRQVRGDHLAVVDQQAGLSLDDFAKTAIGPGNFRHEIVEDQEGDRRHGSARQRGVGTGHGVLDGVRKKQQKGEVKRRHLADFSLAADPNSDQYQSVDRHRSPDDFQQRMQAWR